MCRHSWELSTNVQVSKMSDPNVILYKGKHMYLLKLLKETYNNRMYPWQWECGYITRKEDNGYYRVNNLVCSKGILLSVSKQISLNCLPEDFFVRMCLMRYNIVSITPLILVLIILESENYYQSQKSIFVSQRLQSYGTFSLIYM